MSTVWYTSYRRLSSASKAVWELRKGTSFFLIVLYSAGVHVRVALFDANSVLFFNKNSEFLSHTGCIRRAFIHIFITMNHSIQLWISYEKSFIYSQTRSRNPTLNHSICVWFFFCQMFSTNSPFLSSICLVYLYYRPNSIKQYSNIYVYMHLM